MHQPSPWPCFPAKKTHRWTFTTWLPYTKCCSPEGFNHTRYWANRASELGGQQPTNLWVTRPPEMSTWNNMTNHVTNLQRVITISLQLFHRSMDWCIQFHFFCSQTLSLISSFSNNKKSRFGSTKKKVTPETFFHLIHVRAGLFPNKNS